MTPKSHIGPFELGDPIGEGGMGRVYLATHERTGVDVALKVLSGKADRRSVDRFHREVQAYAGLVHPGIVYLFDYGSVGDELDGEEIPAGSPYVAMELADRGTVRDLMAMEDFETVRQLLLQTLDALAFSHARGVIHRDLKPENLLVFDGGDQHRIKLADFGLVHAFDDIDTRSEQELKNFAGTPFYMSPEQLRSRWRSYGPWTDLYALGCIGWELACGRPPFVADSATAIAMKHCGEQRPQLEPAFPVPDRFDRWVRRLMSIDPRRRFRRAAHAARQLAEMSLPVSKGRASDEGSETMVAELTTLAHTAVEDETTVDLEAGGALPETVELPQEELAETIPAAESDGSVRGGAAPDAAPRTSADVDIPEDWRTDGEGRIPIPLVDTGLELFGLRDVPFVDRDRERDRLWKWLRLVHRRDSLRVVFVVGEAGTGKSRFARWLVTRAHEAGAEVTPRTIHTAGGDGAAEGMSGTVRRIFRAWKMARGDFYGHLREQLPPLDDETRREADARALTEFAYPTADDAEDVDGPRYRFANADQKMELLTRLLARFSRRSPPVVWLDDLQWGPETFDLVEHLVERGDEAPPALMVATLRSEAMAASQLRDRVDALCGRARCERVDLSPLGGDDHRVLIDRLLPLDPGLAADLAERTEGNPLFVRQLLGDWIAGEHLEVGDGGFRLAGGDVPSVPDDIHELWTRRLDRLVTRKSPGRAREILEIIELAACLGREVDEDEWRAVCRRANIRIPVRLLDALFDRGLAERTDEGWAFAHGLLVDSIERRAGEAGRWQRHHRRCARMLEELYADHPQRTARRRADHWIDADMQRRALKPLLDEALRLFETGATDRCLHCLDRRIRLLDELDANSSNPARIEQELVEIRIEYQTGEVSSGREIKERLNSLLERARVSEAPELLAKLHEAFGIWYRKSGEPESARPHLRKCLEFSRRADDVYREGKAWLALARVERIADPGGEQIEECTRRAHECMRRVNRAYDQLDCFGQEGWIALTRADFDRAEAIFDEIAETAREWGLHNQQVSARNALGDIARFREDVPTARRHYERTLEFSTEAGRVDGQQMAYVNLAQIELMCERFERAESFLEHAELLDDRIPGNRLRATLDCIWMVLYAGLGDWEAYDRRFEARRDRWSNHFLVVRDHPWLLELAADFAERAGEDKRARKTLKLARQLWRHLGGQGKARGIGH